MMSRTLKCAIITAMLLIAGAYAQTQPKPFIITVKTDNNGTSANNQFTLPLRPELAYDVVVDFDGTQVSHASGNDLTLTFPGGAGTYDISIQGTFPGLSFRSSGDCQKVLNIKQWGDIAWKKADYAFTGCKNMVISATDKPNISGVTDMRGMFKLCSSLVTVDVNGWDVSNVTSFEEVFQRCYALTECRNINSWNVSQGNDFRRMFDSCRALVQLDVTGWDMSSGQLFNKMFGGCQSLTQLIGYESWDVSKATNFQYMFAGSRLPSLNLQQWNTASLEHLTGMFASAPIGSLTGLENFKIGNLRGANWVFGSNPTLLTVAQYDAVLLSWSSQITEPYLYDVTLEMGTSQYSNTAAVIAARQSLIDNNYPIIDGGVQNTVPVADSLTVSLDSDVPGAITLTGSDADGNPLTFELLSNPSLGTLTGAAPNLTYISKDGNGGRDSFAFRVHDGIAYSAPATVSLNVNVAVWDGGGADTNYSTPANWAGDALPGSNDYLVFDSTSGKPCVIDQDIEVSGFQITSSYAGKVQAGTHTLTVTGPRIIIWKRGKFAPQSSTVKFTGALPKVLTFGERIDFNILDVTTCDVTISNALLANELKANGGAQLIFAPGKTVTARRLTLTGQAGAPITLRSSTPGDFWQLRLTDPLQQNLSYVYVSDSDAGSGAQIVNTTGGIDMGGCTNWLFGPAFLAFTTGTESQVNPAWVEGVATADDVAVQVTIDGATATATTIGAGGFYVSNTTSPLPRGVALTQGTSTTVTATKGTASATTVINWTPTDITTQGTLHVRKGSSLLLTADGAGTQLQIDGDGDGTVDFTGVPGDAFAYQFNGTGLYSPTATIDGAPVGTMTVGVADYTGNTKMGCMYRRTRSRDITAGYPGAPVTILPSGTKQSLNLTISPLADGATITIAPRNTGSTNLYIRLGDRSGPIFATLDVDMFRVSAGIRNQAVIFRKYDDDTMLLGASIEMTPYYPGYKIKLSAITSGLIFEESGSYTYSIPTSNFDENQQAAYYLLSHTGAAFCHDVSNVTEEGE